MEVKVLLEKMMLDRMELILAVVAEGEVLELLFIIPMAVIGVMVERICVFIFKVF